ncbi:alanine racemase [Undibacterium sp. 5I1]|uniref:alanine racemase n=2 Tax=Pseudomonadota TaxID=1224 RepID=UPI002AB4B468|nr:MULTISPECIES: alanine racemase [unclassified Undibacterium]MDY7540550.1 alanine racemase [Undibacterium sp. 5I1]MEB0231212.1 alanine racemase [Undibacterium sp. 10I3]MEB0256515.1 alanine racemase [Undibacterium sp. 5I1]
MQLIAEQSAEYSVKHSGAAGRAGAVLTINLQALRYNYRFLQNKLGRARCGAAVKADAYGLGAVRVALALQEEGCRDFFVAHLDEAIALRPHLLKDSMLYVMHGPPVGYEAEFLEHACTPVLNSLEQIAAWRRLAQAKQTSLLAFIQVDTGMSRMGLSTKEVNAWIADPSLTQGIAISHLMSHLACAEDQQHPMNQQQLQTFKTLRAQLPACAASLANSSGIFLGSDFHFNLARPGAALYGVAPVAGQANPLKAVALLQGKIIQIRDIPAGTGVGYSLTYRSQQPRKIATVAVGYADGWMRSLSNRGVAYIAGQPAPMVGNVSMDTITLDVSDIAPESLYPGAAVDLLSATNTVDMVAKLAGTIGYEILTSLGQRYYREYTDAVSSGSSSSSLSIDSELQHQKSQHKVTSHSGTVNTDAIKGEAQ